MALITVAVDDLRRSYLGAKRRTGMTSDLPLSYAGVPVHRLEFARHGVVRYLNRDLAIMATFQDCAVIND